MSMKKYVEWHKDMDKERDEVIKKHYLKKAKAKALKKKK